jgi:hypothetical protein
MLNPFGVNTHCTLPPRLELGTTVNTKKTPSTGGAQTEPPEDAGPVRTLLGGEDSPADFCRLLATDEHRETQMKLQGISFHLCSSAFICG